MNVFEAFAPKRTKFDLICRKYVFLTSARISSGCNLGMHSDKNKQNRQKQTITAFNDTNLVSKENFSQDQDDKNLI